MSYAAHYYSAQVRVIEDIRFATRTGLCPVCRNRPRAAWPNGERRMTCGDNQCFLRWLPVRAEAPKESEM
jgi:hypothetical protein